VHLLGASASALIGGSLGFGGFFGKPSSKPKDKPNCDGRQA
jgi:hypothetical protein